jgi:hypothetical protein
LRAVVRGKDRGVAPDRALKTGIEGPDEQQDDTVVRSGGRDEEQQLASGRPSSTPFAVVGVVALVIWIVVAVVAALAFLVIWLV